MHPNRPTSVVVMAILNFVIGGLGVAGSCCTFIGYPIFLQIAASAGSDRLGKGLKDMADQFQAIPGYYEYAVYGGLVGAIISGKMG